MNCPECGKAWRTTIRELSISMNVITFRQHRIEVRTAALSRKNLANALNWLRAELPRQKREEKR
jgi:hypothetical protein